jgi:hypothetical protein
MSDSLPRKRQFREKYLKIRDELVTDLFTAMTGRCADTAMLMHLRMLFAFLGTLLTDRGAQGERLLHKQRISKGLTGDNSGCCAADISTIKIQPDTSHQHLHLFLAKAGICTDVARIGAFKAGSDTGGKTFRINGRLSGMGCKHILSSHGISFFIGYFFCSPCDPVSASPAKRY